MVCGCWPRAASFHILDLVDLVESNQDMADILQILESFAKQYPEEVPKDASFMHRLYQLLSESEVAKCAAVILAKCQDRQVLLETLRVH